MKLNRLKKLTSSRNMTAYCSLPKRGKLLTLFTASTSCPPFCGLHGFSLQGSDGMDFVVVSAVHISSIFKSVAHPNAITSPEHPSTTFLF